MMGRDGKMYVVQRGKRWVLLKSAKRTSPRGGVGYRPSHSRIILTEIGTLRRSGTTYHVGGLYSGETIVGLFAFTDKICGFHAYIIATESQIFISPINAPNNEGCEMSVNELREKLKMSDGIEKEVLMEVISYYTASGHLENMPYYDYLDGDL